MIHRKILLGLLILFIGVSLKAQDPQGIITYNRKTDYISIISKLPHMSKEEVDRMSLTWGNWGSEGSDYQLFYKNKKSLYQQVKRENDNGYSWKQDKFILIRDYKNKEREDIIETLGNLYHIKEPMQKRKWKILNEIREIAGYLCMKAETYDPIKDQTIHAWFADGIMISGGPEGFGGLPGLILEIDINDGDAVITATKVNLDAAEEVTLPIPKKVKGKKISKEKFDGIIEKYVRETIEGKKNPYWRVRY